MANEQGAIFRNGSAMCPVPLGHLWIRDVLNVFSSVVELLKAVGITDKERAFPVIEDSAWACELTICRAFLAPLLEEAAVILKVLNALALVWDGIFDRVDVIVLGHRHPTDVVKLSLSPDAIAPPLLKKASGFIEML